MGNGNYPWCRGNRERVITIYDWQVVTWDKFISIVDRSRSSSRWDFHFHSYVLTIYVRLFWLLEVVVFYSLVRRGYIRKVSVQLVPKYFSRNCSTDSISCSEPKKTEEKILKQDNKSRKEDQNVVVVTNPPGSSLLCC